jgi:hypothetical protein
VQTAVELKSKQSQHAAILLNSAARQLQHDATPVQIAVEPGHGTPQLPLAAGLIVAGSIWQQDERLRK